MAGEVLVLVRSQETSKHKEGGCWYLLGILGNGKTVHSPTILTSVKKCEKNQIGENSKTHHGLVQDIEHLDNSNLKKENIKCRDEIIEENIAK